MKISLSSSDIARALPKVRRGVVQYTAIQNTYDSPKNLRAATDFQRRFNAFYRVRRNAKWRSAFFLLLLKSRTRPLSLRQVLTQIYRQTGRIEASFASKLVATANPDLPVIDSVVLKNLGLKLPSNTSSDRIRQVCKLHSQLHSTYKSFLRSRMGRNLVAQFRREYPSAHLSEVKMLDLVLWQSRP